MESGKVYTLLGLIIIGLVVLGVYVRRDALQERRAQQVQEEQEQVAGSNVTVTPMITNTTNNNDFPQFDNPPEMQLEEGVDYRAILRTEYGDITIDLFESDVPMTVNNFVFLTQQNFYQNVPIHRVIEGFMIQTGDPTGTGSGGPGYRFEDEPFEGEYNRGAVAMANAGPDTNGSQFFVMHQDYPLPPDYVIFGQVVDGFDVLDTLATTEVEENQFGELSKPVQPLSFDEIEIVTQ